MGYNDNGIVKVDQEFLQPCDGIQIQVVGRLIQKQECRITEKCLCKKNLDLLLHLSVFHHSVVKLCLDTKTI